MTSGGQHADDRPDAGDVVVDLGGEQDQRARLDRGNGREGRQAQRAGRLALHDEAVALDRLDVRGAADQRDVVVLREFRAVGAADRTGAEDDDPHEP